MIIIDELPFKFVEKKGFRALMQAAVPEWPILNRKQVARGVLDLYNHERTLLLTALKVSGTRISITTDTWTSIQNVNYMVLTAHFIDSDWVLHKRIISFCPILSHKGEDLGTAVESCLRQWENFKIFTITVDNASANDVAVQFLKRRLRFYKTLMFDGEYLHVRCACHIINLIVKDGLKELEDGIKAIWHCVKYIRSSASRLDKFREFAVEENFRSNANIPLDVVTRWNSTYLMLEAALQYEVVFDIMAEEDEGFRTYFLDKVGPPVEDDWKNAQAFCHFLKKFYLATNKLSAWKTVTSNILFVEMISIQTEIANACMSDDLIMRRIGFSMREKYNKYWGTFEQINKLIMIGIVLDPRRKLLWPRLAMQKINAPAHLVQSIESDLKHILVRMYNEYMEDDGDDINSNEDGMDGSEYEDEDDEMDEVSREMTRRMAAEESVLIKNEVDQYLNDRYVHLKSAKFDVASWWKLNQCAYPVLAKIARDVYAVPCSTVASENAFSLGSSVVDPFRSSLTPKMVEALVCCSDWLRGEPLNLDQEPEDDDLVLFAELEEVEREMAGSGKSVTGAAPGRGGGAGAAPGGGGGAGATPGGGGGAAPTTPVVTEPAVVAQSIPASAPPEENPAADNVVDIGIDN